MKSGSLALLSFCVALILLTFSIHGNAARGGAGGAGGINGPGQPGQPGERGGVDESYIARSTGSRSRLAEAKALTIESIETCVKHGTRLGDCLREGFKLIPVDACSQSDLDDSNYYQDAHLINPVGVGSVYEGYRGASGRAGTGPGAGAPGQGGAGFNGGHGGRGGNGGSTD